MNPYKHVGFKEYRLKEDDLYYKKECDFVKAINEMIESNNHTLAQIVGHPTKTWLDEDEEKIALSVIQWLGTPIGQGFLSRVSKM